MRHLFSPGWKPGAIHSCRLRRLTRACESAFTAAQLHQTFDSNIAAGEITGSLARSAALQKLREFDLTHPTVRAKMRERYGNRVPANEPVISPAAMFESKVLIEVIRR